MSDAEGSIELFFADLSDLFGAKYEHVVVVDLETKARGTGRGAVDA